MDSETAVTPTPESATPVVQVQVQSPPRPAVVEKPQDDPRGQLLAMASEVAKKGTRKLLWDYLRLRSRVMGK